MEVKVCGHGDFVKLALADVVDFFKRDMNEGAVVFCNTRYLALELTMALENKLNEGHIAGCDVLIIHDQQSLLDKVHCTQIY